MALSIRGRSENVRRKRPGVKRPIRLAFSTPAEMDTRRKPTAREHRGRDERLRQAGGVERDARCRARDGGSDRADGPGIRRLRIGDRVLDPRQSGGPHDVLEAAASERNSNGDKTQPSLHEQSFLGARQGAEFRERAHRDRKSRSARIATPKGRIRTCSQVSPRGSRTRFQSTGSSSTARISPARARQSSLSVSKWRR